MGYHQAGWEVVGVDIAPQPNYPFRFHMADAMAYPLDGFDAVHASPPCQNYTAYNRRPDHVRAVAHLVGPVRDRLRSWGGPYVIENVPGAPLENPVTLCGSMFELDVRRHRIFEVWPTPPPQPACRHDRQAPRFAPASNRTNLRRTVEVGSSRIPMAVQKRAMGIDWMIREELTQAIPPAYTRWVGQHLRCSRIRTADTSMN